MPCNQLTKDQIKCDVLVKLKNKLRNEYCAEHQKRDCRYVFEFGA